MTTALATSARNPQQCFDGFLSLIERLHGQYDLTVMYMPLGDRLGAWDGPTNTILIDQDATLEDQTWFLTQVWQLVSIGPSAIDPAAVREPRLTVVPTPRVSISNLA